MTQLGAVFFSYNLRKLMKLSVALKICVEQRLILNASVKFKYRVRKNHGKINIAWCWFLRVTVRQPGRLARDFLETLHICSINIKLLFFLFSMNMFLYYRTLLSKKEYFTIDETCWKEDVL